MTNRQPVTEAGRALLTRADDYATGKVRGQVVNLEAHAQILAIEAEASRPSAELVEALRNLSQLWATAADEHRRYRAPQRTASAQINCANLSLPPPMRPPLTLRGRSDVNITQRLAVWRIRWMLRIGWGTTDAQIAQACANWNWRALATGTDIGDGLGRLYEVMGRAPARSLLLSQVGKRRGWATETPESDR